MFNFLNVTSHRQSLSWIRQLPAIQLGFFGFFFCFLPRSVSRQNAGNFYAVGSKHSSRGTSHLLSHVSCLLKHLVAGHRVRSARGKMVCSC